MLAMLLGSTYTRTDRYDRQVSIQVSGNTGDYIYTYNPGRGSNPAISMMRVGVYTLCSRGGGHETVCPGATYKQYSCLAQEVPK